MNIQIYTDGSCLGNPGPGGWAAILIYDGKKHKICGNEKDTTNNRMEMTAIINALEWLYKKIPGETPGPSGIDDLQNAKITIYSDSNLIIQTLNQGWKRKANTDLWAELDKLRGWLNINWVWVKGHGTNRYNNLVDQMAVKEASKLRDR